MKEAYICDRCKRVFDSKELCAAHEKVCLEHTVPILELAIDPSTATIGIWEYPQAARSEEYDEGYYRLYPTSEHLKYLPFEITKGYDHVHFICTDDWSDKNVEKIKMDLRDAALESIRENIDELKQQFLNIEHNKLTIKRSSAEIVR